MAGKKNEAKIKFTAETKEMQDNIKASERAIREYNSELRLNAEQMKTAGESAEALEKRYQILQEEAVQYDRKLEALNQELEVATSIWGENSEEAERLRIKINNTSVSMEKLKQQISSTEEELSRYQKAMGDSGEEADDSRNAYEKLTDQIQEQKSELDKMEDAYKDAILQFGKGSTEAKDLEKRIQDLSKDLGKNEDTMEDLEDAAKAASGQIDDLADSAEDAGDSFTVADGAMAVFAGNALTSLVGFAKDGVSALYNLAEETREYRAEMAKLSSAAKSNGYSTEFAKEKYLDMYAVLADETAANTTVSNFMAMKMSQENLDTVLEAATGIWAKYGDSIPLDGLAESVNETANAGQVTGNLADALNWAGISEDDFNNRLSLCNDTQERQQLIIDTLSTEYGALAKSYKENNKKVMDANRKTAEYNDTMAELGEEMEPVSQAIKEGLMDIVKATMEMVDADTEKVAEKIGDAFEWVAENIETIVRVGKYGAAALGTIFMINKAAQFTNSIRNMVSTFGLLRTATLAQTVATEGQTIAQTGLNTAMSANPIGILIAAGTTLVGVMALINEKHVQEQERIEEEIEKVYGLTEAQEALVESINDRNQSYKDSLESSANEVHGIEQEYAYCQKLVEELRLIVDENGKIKKGNEDRAAVITGILSDALGIEIEITDGVIQKYEELNSTIEDVIRMKKAEAVLSAHESAWTEAVQGQTDAANELIEAQKNLEEAKKKTADADEKFNEALEEYSQILQENAESNGAMRVEVEQSRIKFEAARDACDKARESQKEFEDAIDTTRDTLNDYNAEIANYEGLQEAIFSGEADQVEAAMARLTNSFLTAEFASRESLEQQVKDFRETYENLKQAVEEGTPGVTQEMVDSASSMVDAAERELKKFDAVTPLAAGMDAGVAVMDKKRALAERSIQATVQIMESTLRSINTHGIAESSMDDYSKGITDTEPEILNVVDRVIGDYRGSMSKGDWYGAGYSTTEGFANGALSYNIGSVGASIGTKMLQSLRKSLDSHSPSRKAYKIGTDTTTGYTNAIEDDLGKVEAVSQKMGQAVLAPIDKMSRTGFKDLMDGGVNLGMSAVTDGQGVMGRHIEAAVAQEGIDYGRLGDIFIQAVSRIKSSIVISDREAGRYIREVMG